MVNIFGINLFKVVTSTIVMGIVVFILQKLFNIGVALSTMLSVVIGVIVYVGMLIAVKEELFIDESSKIRKKLKL